MSGLVTPWRARRGEIPTDGLVALYDMVQAPANPQRLTDRSGNDRHATLGSTAGADSSDPTWSPQGLQFDGVGDRVLAPAAPPGAASFTLIVAAMLKPNATVSNYADVVGWRKTAARGWLTLNMGAGAQVNWEYRDSASPQVASDLTNAGVYSQGVWGVYALTVDRQAGVMRAYLNGQLTRSRTIPANFGSMDADSTLHLGGGETGKTPNTQGHATLYTRALSDAEIARLYTAVRGQLRQRGVTLP